MSDDFQGRGGSPWGKPPGGGNGSGKGPTPPDIDALIRDIQSRIKRFLPGGSSSGGKPIGLILIIIAFVWLASGLYRVGPDEQGVVLRFGKFVKTTQPGLHYHIPLPVETVQTPKVTKVNRIDIGFRSERDSGFSQGGGVADVPQESLMLTGDENIVNIDFSVFWVIKDAGKFLFEIQDPEGTVKAAAETAMREVIAKSKIQPVLTEGRAQIEIETQEIIQSILDEYNSGIQITQVQTQKADTRNLFFVEKIKSEIRFEIDKQFRTEKIIIPFPQRTVWHGTERVTQFEDGIVGTGEVRSSETDAPSNRPF